MAATVKAFLSARVTDVSLKPLPQPPPPPPPPFSHHLLIRPLLPAISTSSSSRRRSPSSSSAVSCLISGVDGGGVSDDFVSTRKTGFGREFAVIANMLKRIEPLDTSVISKGVSESAKDSMKQTISSMLGLLPSEQFSVTVRVSKRPLDRLIVSSIITGYTLWNAEYRISLMRNFDMSIDSTKKPNISEENGCSDLMCEKNEGGGYDDVADIPVEVLDRMNLQNLGSLSPEALNYIQQLELELSTVKQELHDRKQQNLQMECIKRSNNDLLQYLRSLEPDMVTELSRPSSLEVDEVIHQLAQNILGGFFKEEIPCEHHDNSTLGVTRNFKNGDNVSCHTISTSRDYLAKLLFWCMLLGHHLRGLENRLHLSCVVGLL